MVVVILFLTYSFLTVFMLKPQATLKFIWSNCLNFIVFFILQIFTEHFLCARSGEYSWEEDRQGLSSLGSIGKCGGEIAFHGYKTAQRHGGNITQMIYRHEHRVELGWSMLCIQRKENQRQKQVCSKQ